MADNSDAPVLESNGQRRPPFLVVDIGKQKRKQIRRLRKGNGKLMGKVQDALDDMKADDLLAENTQVVVLVVKEKKAKRKFGSSSW